MNKRVTIDDREYEYILYKPDMRNPIDRKLMFEGQPVNMVGYLIEPKPETAEKAAKEFAFEATTEAALARRGPWGSWDVEIAHRKGFLAGIKWKEEQGKK